MKATILTCTADSASPLFIRHLKALKRHTDDFEWIVIDNNRQKGFNHAREINRALSIARGDYLVLLDDDLIVAPNWLDALIQAAKVNRAVVAGGIHRYDDRRINHSGGYFLPQGWAGHYIAPLTRDTCFPYLCSAVMLIDWKRCREWKLTFDETYQKYYQEADFCLSVWKRGGRVVSTPNCDVFHLVRQTMNAREDGQRFGQADSQYFKTKWVANNKLEKILTLKDVELGFGKVSHVEPLGRLMDCYNSASANSDRDAAVHDFKSIYETSRKLRQYEHGQNFAGGACYHLGRILAETNREGEASRWLERCLTFIPQHQKAAQLLNTLSR